MCQDCIEVESKAPDILSPCKILPKCGVRLGFLEHFIAWNKIPAEWTTKMVVDNVIKDHTRARQERYVDFIKRKFPDENFVGEPTIFVSHSWSRPFVELVNTLTKRRMFGSCNRRKYIWLDVFTVHQHKGENQVMDLRAFMECVRFIGYTVVILDNGLIEDKCQITKNAEKPRALSRIWCLAEIYHTIKSKGKLQFISTTYLFGGVGQYRCCFRQPFEVKCLNAEATEPEDLARILCEMDQVTKKCKEAGCAGVLIALPYETVHQKLQMHRQSKNIFNNEGNLICIDCGCCQEVDFGKYLMFCNFCMKTVLCRDCALSGTNLMNTVDGIINEQIIQIWGEHRCHQYLLSFFAVLSLFFVIIWMRVLVETWEVLEHYTTYIISGVISFGLLLGFTSFLICLYCGCTYTRPDEKVVFGCTFVTFLCITSQYIYFININLVRFNYLSLTFLGFVTLIAIICCLFKKQWLSSRRFWLNFAPGSWPWWFSCCFFYYICCGWICCNPVWIKGNQHHAPRKCCGKAGSFLLAPFKMCMSCGTRSRFSTFRSPANLQEPLLVQIRSSQSNSDLYLEQNIVEYT